MSRRLVAVLSLVLALDVAAAKTAAAGGGADTTCYGDWSEAAPVVRRENLRAARDVHELARARLNGDLVRITLCREASRYVYHLLLRDLQGRISNLKVDAATPFDR